MKTILTLILLTIYSLNSSAQKGTLYAGANLGLSRSDHKTLIPGPSYGTGNAWSFSTETGVFLTDQIQVGGGFTFSKNKGYGIGFTHSIIENKLYGITGYARYFLGKARIKPFAGLSTSILAGKWTQSFFSDKRSSNLTRFSINLNTGISYNLTRKLTVMGSITLFGFTNTTAKYPGSDEKYQYSSFGAETSALSDRFNFGIYYAFKKKK